MSSLWGYIRSKFNYLTRSLSRFDGNLSHNATGDEIAFILNTHLFRKMTEDELAKLISSIQLNKYNAGELILEEGDASQELFIITEGIARVFINDEAGNKIQLKELFPGNYFGEQAVIGGKFKTRNASIEAITDISLIKIHGKYIYNLLKKDSSLKSLIEERKVSQAVNIIAHASIFQHEIESLLSNLDNPHVLEFRNKECIFKAGDKADRVYMVIQGKVKLLIPQKDNDSFSEIILNKGHLFGELGVMNDAPRSGTAIAEGNLRLLGIDGDDFKKDISISNSFKLKLARLQRMYALPLRGTVEQYTKVVPPNVGPSIINVYNLRDGMNVHSAIVLDTDEFSMWVDDRQKGKSICYDKGDDHVEIFVHDHQLVGIKANGSFDALPELCYMLIECVNIDDEDLELFKSTGKLKEAVIA